MGMPQISNSAKKTSKRTFRINFYGFLVIAAMLVVGVVALALQMQSEVQSYRQAKQAQRASVADIKTESKKIDAVWHTLSTDMLSYSSATRECIKEENGTEIGTCLPDAVYAKLQVASSEPALIVADNLVAYLESAGWKQRNYTIKTTSGDNRRYAFTELPADFQNIRFYYASPHTGDAQRCLSLIFSSKNAQTPGWNGYLGKCSS
ncbi:MAG TPA: hypothetical protein VFZ58_01320 [Candidatus Saccharimonadales bacterium]